MAIWRVYNIFVMNFEPGMTVEWQRRMRSVKGMLEEQMCNEYQTFKCFLTIDHVWIINVFRNFNTRYIGVYIVGLTFHVHWTHSVVFIHIARSSCGHYTVVYQSLDDQLLCVYTTLHRRSIDIRNICNKRGMSRRHIHNECITTTTKK